MSRSTLLVADTGPLIALAGADALELLRQLYSRVVMPTTVRDELGAAGGDRAGFAAVKAAGWLEILAPPGEPDAFLAGALDAGEAAVIALARSLPGAAVLMDERRGRRVAHTAFRLEVVGTVGVLIAAKRAGLLGAVKPSIDRIVANGYFLSERLVAEALRAAGESSAK